MLDGCRHLHFNFFIDISSQFFSVEVDDRSSSSQQSQTQQDIENYTGGIGRRIVDINNDPAIVIIVKLQLSTY